MEVAFKIGTRISEIVNQGSLFYKVILIIDSDVFNLFLGLYQMLQLFLFYEITPLFTDLGVLVSNVSGVEN